MNEEKPLADQIWYDWFMSDAAKIEKRYMHFMSLLPSSPRCKFCNAPFHGVGGAFVRTFVGVKQSKLNPRFCSTCEDFAKKHPGGHEVEMSMLFADIRGSTALSEKMRPTEFQRLINRFYIESTNVIVHEDGVVEKLAGDAVAAFWGAGIAGPKYVARTIQAAKRIMELMEHAHIPIGIGIHTGVAYFGAMGSADGLVDISAIGDEVNTAARIASKAGAGEILVSESALRDAQMDAANLESRSLELKGISAPVTVHVMRI